MLGLQSQTYWCCIWNFSFYRGYQCSQRGCLPYNFTYNMCNITNFTYMNPSTIIKQYSIQLESNTLHHISKITYEIHSMRLQITHPQAWMIISLSTCIIQTCLSHSHDVMPLNTLIGPKTYVETNKFKCLSQEIQAKLSALKEQLHGRLYTCNLTSNQLVANGYTKSNSTLID